MHLKRRAIGPAGQDVYISLATGKTVTSMIGNNYGQLKAAEKAGRDWVWYDDFEDEDARDALIASRRAVHASKNAEYQQMFESKLDKLAKALENATTGNQRPQLTDEQLERAMLGDAKPAVKSKPKAKPE